MSTLGSVIGRGLHSARPAAGTAGALYYETDTSTLFRDSGSAWESVEGSSTPADILDIPTAETDTTLVLAPDGAGGVEFRAETGGGGSFTSYDSLIGAMSGLVHRWEFAEASGNFADGVGSLTLTPSGTFTYAVSGAPVGGAVTFGASAKADSSGLGSIPTGAGARSFVVIYKPPSSTSKQAVFSYGTSGTTRQWFSQFVNDVNVNTWSAAVWGDDATLGQSGSSQIVIPSTADTLWHMGAVVYDGALSLLVFHDTISTVRRLGGSLATGSSGNFRIGQDTASANQSSLTVDDIAVFNRALQPYEISQLYAALAGALP